jgi:hypothetical protein
VFEKTNLFSKTQSRMIKSTLDQHQTMDSSAYGTLVKPSRGTLLDEAYTLANQAARPSTALETAQGV